MCARSLFFHEGFLKNSKRVVDEDSAKIMNLPCSRKAQEINALLFVGGDEFVTTLEKSENGLRRVPRTRPD